MQTATEVTDRTLFEAAGLNRRTAEAYERLLRTLVLVDVLPAWSSNLVKRLVRAPKRFLRDTGLAAAVLDVDVPNVLRNGDVLGRLLETFVLAQVRAEQSLYDHPPSLHHLRQEGGAHEVDLVAEVGLRRVVGIEVTASAAPGPADARHLTWLRDQLGDGFLGGVVLHTGPRVYPLADRVVAAPIGTLWA